MDDQDQGRQDAKEPQPPSRHDAGERRARDDDSTWGIGAASALDSLRRQDFRGKRSAPKDEGKPTSV